MSDYRPARPLDLDSALKAGARGIAAAVPLDWPSLESAAADDAVRHVIRQLRILADISEVHRNLPDAAGAVTTPSVWDSANANAGPTARTLDDETYTDFASWGSLRLLERVGEGSFGEVYRAWDSRLDREVALKLLRARDPNRDSVGRAVIEEGRLLARVNHPNVVTIYGADRVDGRVGLWMEFVRGRTLEHVLHLNGTLSPQEAASIGLDLCRALSAVHRAGLVHRDVKAQNVMRESNGRIVLMDFGTGELVDENPEGTAMAGTPLYLAPEVLRNEKGTPAADIYSLGVLLYHLLTSGYPVTGSSIEDIRDAHRQGRRTYLRDIRPDLPARFVDVIERALASAPPGRFESAGMMERALTEALVGTDDASPVPVKRAGKRSLSGWLSAVQPGRALGAAVIAVTGILLFASWRSGDLRWVRNPSEPAPATKGTTGPSMRMLGLPAGWSFVGRPASSGRHLPFADGDGDLALLDPDSGAIRKVTNKGDIDEGAEMGSAISPDGKQVAYLWRTLGNNLELRLIGVDGKWPRILVRRDDVAAAHPIQWSRDGERILSLLSRTDRTYSLAFVDARTGVVSDIRNLGYIRPQNASISPDGRYIVYDHPQNLSSASRDVFLISADGGREIPLVRHDSNDLFPLWTPDGKGVLFFSDRTASLGAWFQEVLDGKPAGEPRVLDKAIGRMMPIGLTDSGTLFFHKPTEVVDVYVANLDAAGRISESRVIAPNFVGDNLSSGFSPNGRYTAWVSMRGAIPSDRYSHVLCVRDSLTGSQRDILPPLAFFTGLRWASDNRRIVVRGYDFQQRFGLHIVDVQSGRVEPAVTGSDNDIGNAVWSADGRAILYGRSNKAIVSRDLQTGAERVLVDVSAEGLLGRGTAQTFGISPDGRAIAFRVVRQDAAGTIAANILRVKLFGGHTQDLVTVGPSEGIEFQDWSADGRAAFFTRFTRNDRRTRTLWSVDIGGGEPRATGLTMSGLQEVRVRKDGRLATFTAGGARWELWTMENFLPR